MPRTNSLVATFARAAAGAVAAVALAASAGCGNADEPGTGTGTGRSRPGPGAGSGQPAAFALVGTLVGKPPVAEQVDVTDPAARNRYLAALPAGPAGDLREQLAAGDHRGDRLIAVRLIGCRRDAGARLDTDPATGRHTAALTGEPIECVAAVTWVAVFEVPK